MWTQIPQSLTTLFCLWCISCTLPKALPCHSILNMYFHDSRHTLNLKVPLSRYRIILVCVGKCMEPLSVCHAEGGKGINSNTMYAFPQLLTHSTLLMPKLPPLFKWTHLNNKNLLISTKCHKLCLLNQLIYTKQLEKSWHILSICYCCCYYLIIHIACMVCIIFLIVLVRTLRN